MIQEKIVISVFKIRKKIKQSNIGSSYYNFLRLLHKTIKPKKYLEIGVCDGSSIVLANSSTVCYGVDPAPNIKVNLSENITIYTQTSDDFFKDYKEANVSDKKFDFAFIDGMHLFDFVLRDFINTEKHCNKNAIIALHDTIPRDEETSRRDNLGGFWTGDVYKFVLILKKYRPDLKILNTDAKPSGVLLVKNLDPESTVLSDNYDKIVEEYMGMEYSEIESNKVEALSIKSYKEYKKFLKK